MKNYAKGSPAYWSLRCFLTDHRYDWTFKIQSEPYCLRCGDGGYWPVRRTAGGCRERLKGWVRYRWRKHVDAGIPF